MNKLALSNFSELQLAAQAMAKSEFFSDANNLAKATVKVLAGSELGIGPFASMTGIHIIKGKPAIGANIIAALIKNDPRYDYRVIKMDSKVCEIEFYQGAEKIGVSTFTAEDAKKAGTQNMQKFPRNMLFARAMSNGAKWFVPGIFGGAPVYTPEELGAEVDEDGDIIDVTPEPVVEVVQEREEILDDLGYSNNEPEPSTNGDTWPAAVINPIVKEYKKSSYQIRGAFKKSVLTKDDPPEKLKKWYSLYNGAREDNSESDEAAKIANFNIEASDETD